MSPAPRVILIGGTSHVGKSTLARHLAERPGWTAISTDSLARHPGRPWPQGERPVPPQVVEHYLTLTHAERLASVLAHYRSMWPTIESLVRRHAEGAAEPALVLEGSALWPETVATLRLPAVSAVWLTADEGVFERRMHAESRYAEADETGRALIEAFLERTRRYDTEMMQAVRRLGLPFVEVREAAGLDALADLALSRMAPLA